MINNYCNHLNVDFDIDRRYLDTLMYDPSYKHKWGPFLIPAEYQCQNFKSWLQQRDLYISHAEIFHTPPNNITEIHIDGGINDTCIKINWVFGAEASSMKWWQPNEGTNGPILKMTQNNTPYLYYDPHESHAVFESKVGSAAFLNTAEPHNVINLTDQHRWAMSFVIRYRGNASANYETLKKHLSPWIIS